MIHHVFIAQATHSNKPLTYRITTQPLDLTLSVLCLFFPFQFLSLYLPLSLSLFIDRRGYSRVLSADVIYTTFFPLFFSSVATEKKKKKKNLFNNVLITLSLCVTWIKLEILASVPWFIWGRWREQENQDLPLSVARSERLYGRF